MKRLISVATLAALIGFAIGRVSGSNAAKTGAKQSIVSKDADFVAQNPNRSDSQTGKFPESSGAIPSFEPQTPSSSRNSVDGLKPISSATNTRSRREIIALESERKRRLSEFLGTDTQFPSKVKFGEAEWAKLKSLGNFDANVKFQFEPTLISSFKLRLNSKVQQVQLAARFRPSNAGPNSSHMITHTGNLDNGDGVGFSRDANSFAVVIPNPVEDGDWIDYSAFAILLPPEGNKSATRVDVFGLTEDLKWVVVGFSEFQKR